MKNNLIYILTAVVVLGGVGLFVALNGTDKDISKEKVSSGTLVSLLQEEDKEKNNNTNSEKLLEEYMKTGKGNLKCVLHMEEEGGIVDQTVYISGVNIRMDMTTKYKDKTAISHMITDKDNTYMWGTNGNFVMKNDNSDLEESFSGDTQDMENPGENADRDLKDTLEKIPENNCEIWSVDETKFEVPKDIEFKSFEDMWKTAVQDIKPEDMPNMDELKKVMPKDALDDEEIMNSIEDMFKQQK